jgi:hypothetical protein
MYIVLLVLIDLDVISFSIGGRGSLKYFAIDLVHFLLELAYPVVDGLLLFDFGLLGREP